MKTIYKKTKNLAVKLISFTALFVIMWSCSDEFLEPKPLSVFTPENALTTVASMYNGLAACDVQIREEMYEIGRAHV